MHPTPHPHTLSSQFRGQGVHLRFGSGHRDVGGGQGADRKGDEGGSPQNRWAGTSRAGASEPGLTLEAPAGPEGRRPGLCSYARDSAEQVGPGCGPRGPCPSLPLMVPLEPSPSSRSLLWALQSRLGDPRPSCTALWAFPCPSSAGRLVPTALGFPQRPFLSPQSLILPAVWGIGQRNR